MYPKKIKEPVPLPFVNEENEIVLERAQPQPVAAEPQPVVRKATKKLTFCKNNTYKEYELDEPACPDVPATAMSKILVHSKNMSSTKDRQALERSRQRKFVKQLENGTFYRFFRRGSEGTKELFKHTPSNTTMSRETVIAIVRGLVKAPPAKQPHYIPVAFCRPPSCPAPRALAKKPNAYAHASSY